jgi:hypothetical protein
MNPLPPVPRVSWLSLALFATVGAPGCRRPPPTGTAAPATSGSAAFVPVDRLAPGELAPSKLSLFGLALPRGMKVEGVYGDVGYASGRLRREEVSNFVRTRVSVAHVELGVARTVFPGAQILGQPPNHRFRIEVFGKGMETRIAVRRFIPQPAPSNISEAERWRRAGFNPDGTPLDPNSLE